MSDELRLPDDLAACEARLAAQPLAPSRIDRDQLMYRAGWAACEARLALAPPSSPKMIHFEAGGPRGASRRSLAAWSTLSAALAASLAVALTLHFDRSSQTDLAAARPVAPTAVEVDSARSQPIWQQHARVELARAGSSASRVEVFQTGLIALRRQAVTNPWARPANRGAVSSDEPPPAAKTARELLLEFLPGEPPRSAGVSMDQHSTPEEFPATA